MKQRDQDWYHMIKQRMLIGKITVLGTGLESTPFTLTTRMVKSCVCGAEWKLANGKSRLRGSKRTCIEGNVDADASTRMPSTLLAQLHQMP